MALLELKNVGKIYASENAIAVGIRGVNLSFDMGEFVAVTGSSGSGKTTLLNVISGMDAYEEGELFIEGQPTAHYLQSEWETYREKYISFIFQDYNIIDSFTVLENVELALMNIESARERRNTALALLDRVGMTPYIHQKGSKLSGGQKQRTVIARALAKDSPIILADEPTGNLDSQTAKEIIQLLAEVGKEKLVILVTHSFDEVAEVATREVRIFDGAVEFDHSIRPTNIIPFVPKEKAKRTFSNEASQGFALGKSLFAARPRLTLFLVALLFVGFFGMFISFANSSSIDALFEDNNMFTHMDGRVIVTRQDGGALSKEELTKLKTETGAVDMMHFDYLLDCGTFTDYLELDDDYYYWFDLTASAVKDKEYENVIGRYPEKANEILLYIPISLQSVFGKDAVEYPSVTLGSFNWQVVGLSYFYDNSKTAEFLLTDEGWDRLTAVANLPETTSLFIADENGYDTLTVSYPLDSIVLSNSNDYLVTFPESVKENITKNLKEENGHFVLALGRGDSKVSVDIPESKITYSKELNESYNVLISADFMTELAQSYMEKTYRQGSLFYENDDVAETKAEELHDMGYIAVCSNATYSEESLEAILRVVLALFSLVSLVITVVFMAFLIRLCTGRSVQALRSDLAILRSMGIPVKTIKVAIFVRMLFCLALALLLGAGTVTLIYVVPDLNGIFAFLHWDAYALIVACMLWLVVRVTRRQLRDLFDATVKNAMRGGSAL